MSYRSEMKKVIEKYYPKYKVQTVLSPTLHNLGINNNKELRITIPLIKKSKTRNETRPKHGMI